MRKLAILIAILAFLPVFSYGQNELIVEPFITSGKMLDVSIKGDTLATGARVNPDRVYVLRRGGLYWINNNIQNTKYPLRIRAEYGTGKKPIIYASRPTATTYPPQLFLADSTLELRNLCLVGWDDGGEAFSSSVNQIITVTRTGQSMTIDSCLLTNTTQRHLYINAAMKNVIITNTVFTNGGNLRANNLGNGRAVDFRTVSVDSVLFQNCSFVNMHDRFIRHYGVGQAPIRSFTLDHCTIVNDIAEHGCLGLGAVNGKIQITNNLFVDNFVFGNDSTAAERLTEFGDTGERGPTGAYRMTFIGSVPTDTITNKWIVQNNYYSVSPTLQAFYDSRNGLPDQGIGNLIPLTWHINKKIADSVNAFKKVTTPIVFTKAPGVPVPLAQWFFLPIAQGGSGKIKQNATFLAPYSQDYDRRETFYFRDTLNLSYPTSSVVYTGSSGGFPAGDLNWYPSQKSAWITAGKPTTGVENFGAAVPSTFVLEQNYPNPFNPSTNIAFTVPKIGRVTLKVFNALGQQVATLVDANYDAGKHQVNFDASSLSSGVYVYTLSSGDFLAAKKMILVK
jgi:hypothetical protein